MAVKRKPMKIARKSSESGVVKIKKQKTPPLKKNKPENEDADEVVDSTLSFFKIDQTKVEEKTKAEVDDEQSKLQPSCVVYVGRLPEGFEEYEIKDYFKQFGKVLSVRVSRSQKVKTVDRKC